MKCGAASVDVAMQSGSPDVDGPFARTVGTNWHEHCFPRTLKRRTNMNIIILLVVGGILGWLASIVMRTDRQQGIFLNVVVGIVGAFLAGFIITPLIGGAPVTSGAFDIQSLIASFLGAVVLLAIVNLVRRGRVR
jgi:uncharacterized membrane protein YeaQ/YmgE (transglycosylase-associated protein family)